MSQRELPKELSFEGETGASGEAFERLCNSLDASNQEVRDEMSEEEAQKIALIRSSPWGDSTSNRIEELLRR